VERGSEVDYQSSRAAGVPTKALANSRKKESLGRVEIEEVAIHEEHKNQKKFKNYKLSKFAPNLSCITPQSIAADIMNCKLRLASSNLEQDQNHPGQHTSEHTDTIKSRPSQGGGDLLEGPLAADATLKHIKSAKDSKHG
jgi:hypothetical protein